MLTNLKGEVRFDRAYSVMTETVYYKAECFK